MTGYQEILTDPSYFGQIVTMTAVQIGNYGINARMRSRRAAMLGICRARGLAHRQQLAQHDVAGRLSEEHGIPGISEVDTRALTKKLRVDGAMKCCLSTLPLATRRRPPRPHWRDMAGSDYVKDVTCREPFVWRATMLRGTTPSTCPSARPVAPRHAAKKFKVAAFDYGAK